MRTAFSLHRINKALLTQGVHEGASRARRHTGRRRQRPGTYATLQQLAQLIAQHFDNTPDPLGAIAITGPATRRARVEAIMAPLRKAMGAGERLAHKEAEEALGQDVLLAKRLRKLVIGSLSHATAQPAAVNM